MTIEEFMDKAMATSNGRAIGHDKLLFIFKHIDERKSDLAMICNVPVWRVWQLLRDTGAVYKRRQCWLAGRYADDVRRLYAEHSAEDVAKRLHLTTHQVKYLVSKHHCRKSEEGMRRLNEQRRIMALQSPRRVEKIKSTWQRLIAEERRRILEGKPQKTKIKFSATDTRKPKWSARYHLMRTYGYEADRQRPHILYYHVGAKRTPKERHYEIKYGFKFYPKK